MLPHPVLLVGNPFLVEHSIQGYQKDSLQGQYVAGVGERWEWGQLVEEGKEDEDYQVKDDPLLQDRNDLQDEHWGGY